MSVILSPKTGKLINVNSKAYDDLLNDPQYKDYLFDISEETKGSVKPSGSPIKNLSPLPVLPSAPRMKLPSLNSSSNKNKLPSLPSSPIYNKLNTKINSYNTIYTRVSPVYSPPSPSNSLSDVSMPIPIPLSPVKSLPSLKVETLRIPLKNEKDRNIKCCGWK